MQRLVLFCFLASCAVSALSLAKDTQESKDSATVAPAQQFTSFIDPKNTTTPATTPTTTPKTTPTTTPKTTPTTTPKTTPTTTPKTTPTTTPKTTPTTKPKTTPTTTTKTTPTTTPKTTPTTKPKTTTTPKTTPKTTPTTTPKTTAKTTPKPTTRPTTKPITTVPWTTPATTLIVGNYSLKTSKGDTCLLAHMALKIRLESAEANGTFVVQPQAATVEGSCGNTNANLSIVFAQGCITFLFNKSVANNTVYVNALSFNLTYAFKKGESKRYSVSNATNLFPAKIGHSYSCKNESIHMGNGLYLDVSQDRMQAFNLTNNDFGRSDPCPADQPDYRVAIAVGVTLLVLIVLVLVVYLLGRRKRTDGYQSL
ncbi:lysosome-associated membrane glycoprotein 2-like [Menidia menidia]